MADDDFDPDEHAEEAGRLCETSLVTGSVDRGILPIKIFYKVSRNWRSFEFPSSNNIYDLRAVCDANNYSIAGTQVVTSLDLGALGILDAAKRFMSTASEKIEFASAQLEKLTIYTRESGEPPVCLNAAGDHDAALVVLLPTGFRGGDLVVLKEQDTEIPYAWTNMDKFQWAAIRAGFRYRLQPIIVGYCVMLTYRIFLEAEPPEVVKDASPELKRFLRLVVRRADCATVLGFPCKNLYHEALVAKSDAGFLERMLRDEDAVIYQAARRARLKVDIVRLWKIADGSNDIYIDRAFNGFELSRYVYKRDEDFHRVGRMIEMSSEPRTVEYDHIVSWASDDHRWLPGACHTFECDDGETGPMTVDCAAAILVTVIPKAARKHVKRELAFLEEP